MILQNDGAETFNRRSFLAKAGIAGAGLIGTGVLAGCGGSSTMAGSSATTSDKQIIEVAIVAEALAVTTYSNIISSNIYKVSLASRSDDQGYFVAAQAEEQIHLNDLSAAIGTGPTSLTCYFPVGMFSSAQVTMDTLVALEEAFIAAYLIGVSQFSVPALRVFAARILGVESDHRSLARVIGADIGLTSITGLSKQPESVEPANNIAYEQTFGLTSISQAQTALAPFINATAASNAGFSGTPYPYTAIDVTGSPLNNLGS